MNIWLKEKKQDVILKILLFFISPFIAFLYSLRSIKTKSSYLIFFFTAVFFGMAFSVVSGKDLSEGGIDGQAYRAYFEEYKYVSNIDFNEGFISFLSFDEGRKDYYFNTIAFYISRITDNYHIMFMSVAIIFSYFALKSFKFLTQEEKFDTSIVSYILSYLFLYNQIFNINGIRFWTAAWIAVYCIFQIYRNGNKKYFFLALLTPYFHGSYWIFLGVLVVAYFFKKFERFWIGLFFASFFASTLAIEFIQYFESYLPGFLSKLALLYTSEEVLAKTWSGFGWIQVVFKNVVLFYLTAMVFLFIKHSEEIKKERKTKDLYLFLLVWVSVFNFLMLVPSLGDRFIQLSYPIISYIWLVSFKDYRYKSFILFLPIAFIWSILVYILYYREVLTPGFYISSPFYLIYKYIIVA